MDYSEIGVGNKINMVRMEDSRGRKTESQQYVSQLLDIDAKEGCAKISMPIQNKVIIPLEIGDIYRIVIYTSGGLYQCMAKISRRYKENSLYLLDIDFVGRLEKYQRRQYYRLMCDMVVKHRNPTEEEIRLKDMLIFNEFKSVEEKQACIDKIENMAFEWNNGQVVDISGGGIRFMSPVPYENDAVIILRIEGSIPSMEECDINLRIVRSERNSDAANEGRYEIRGEYVDINNVMRENLVRYIFEEQRRRIKKEMPEL